MNFSWITRRFSGSSKERRWKVLTVWRGPLESSSVVSAPGGHHGDVLGVEGCRGGGCEARVRVSGVRMGRMWVRVSRVRTHRGGGCGCSCGAARVAGERVVGRVRLDSMLPRGCCLLPFVSFRFVWFRVEERSIGALVGSVERERREERNGRCRPPLTADGTPNVDLPGGRTGTGERVVLSRRCGCRGCRRCRWNGGPRGRHVDGRLELLAVLLLLLLGLLLVVGTRAVPAASAPVEHPPRKLEPRHLPDRSETSSLHLPLPVFRLARSPRGSTGDQARADRAAPRNYSKTRSRQLTARTKAKRRFEGARPERDGEKGRRSG